MKIALHAAVIATAAHGLMQVPTNHQHSNLVSLYWFLLWHPLHMRHIMAYQRTTVTFVDEG